MENATPQGSESSRKWRPINRVQRRVLGVLVEKSKTTPDVYPMTLNGITTAANQKSNRSPLMSLEPDEVQIALDQLRLMGAVVEVHGDGRVPKYKHLLYDWFGAEKGELAIMAELLLRGQQTLGELRARAARMEDIGDLAQLRPLVDSLLKKNLMLELTPPGRGQVVSHNLYQPEELDKVKSLVEQLVDEDADAEETPTSNGTNSGSANLAQRVAALEQQLAEVIARLNRIES
jgi:hypothetical protein